jgi:hypothetical protein
MAELLISANNANTQQIGEVVDTKPDGHIWGTREQPPNYVHLTVTGATRDQVRRYIDGWNIRFQHDILAETAVGYRIRVSVDPAAISASDVGSSELKLEMQTWVADSYGALVTAFTPDSMTVDVPKPADLAKLKSDFADVFDDVLAIRRYRFSEADVNTALGNGGKITLTKAQALARVIDKLDL